MMDAGLLQSKQSLTNVELQNSIAKTLSASMSREDAAAKTAEIMSSMGLRVAMEGEETQIVQLTALKLQHAVTSGLLSEAEAMEIAMHTSATVAMEAQTTGTMPKWIASMKAMAMATWEQVKATAAWLISNPAGWAILAVGAIAGVTAGLIYNSKAAERAQEKISDLQDEYSNGISDLENMRNKLSDVNEQIEKLKSKGKITFADKEELENLKEQRNELEKKIVLQEKSNQQKAQETVSKIKKSNKKLNKKFDEDLKNYESTKETLESQKESGLRLMAAGDTTKENYDSTISVTEDHLNKYYGSILEDIDEYEKNRQSIIDKYNGDLSKINPSDKKTFDDITSKLNSAYKAVYSKAEYNQFVIEPIFKTEGLKNFQQEIVDYFINNGSLDVDALEERFGSSIIKSLRSACEKSGIEFDSFLSDLYQQAQETSYSFAPKIKKPNSSYDAQQNQKSQAKIDYYNSLDDETKKIIIEAEIPEEIKNSTLQEFKAWVEELQDNVQIKPAISFDNAWNKQSSDVQNSLRDLATSGDLTREALLNNDAYLSFLSSIGLNASSSSSEFDKLIGKIEKLNMSMTKSDIEDYQIALEKVKNGQSLTAVETANLISKNNNLANAVKKTKDGYMIEEEVLRNVMNQSIEEYNISVSNQIKKTETVISQVKQRIKAIKKEIDSIIAAEESYTYFTSPSDIAYNGQKREELSEEQRKQDKKLRKLLNKLNKLNDSLQDPASSSDNTSESQTSQTKSTETIDWIARRLEVLQSAIDLTKSKFENLFRFQAKKNNINAQIKQTTKLLQAQEKVADIYAKKAANVSLSSDIKKKVKKGQINGKLSELLKDYDEDTANKISKYQEYWDKSQDSQKSVQELKKSRKELMDQKDQLHVDRAEQKISTLDAKAEISNTAKEKNILENKKIEQLKESYQYQIKIAEREKNSAKVTELRARKEKEILEIKKQILQNTLDENEATRSYNDARYANAKTVAEKNAILDHDIESYRSDQQANETYYSELESNTQKKAKKKKKSLGTNALMSSLASSQVAEKNKNKILDLIKKGKPIPDSILNRKNVKNNPDLLNKLIEYNNSLDDITKEVEKVQQDKDKADQETKTAIREKEIQKLQNNADAAEANYNLSKIREDNAITAKEKNKQEENSRASLIEQYDYLKKIAETNGDIVEQQRLEEELQEKIAQSYQTEFNNIKAEYEKKTTLNEGNISSIQAEISALQAQGKSVSENFYGSLINDTRYKKKLLIEEKNDLEDKLASLEVGSDAWYEAMETLDNLDVSIIKCDEDTAQFTKTINEQKLALLSLKTTQIQSGIDHVSFLIDELSHKDLTKKESGGFTTEGLTVLSLYASQMQQNKDKLATVRASYDEFQKQVALGISNLSEEEIHAKNDDYMKQIRDIISANSALKDSMISLVKEGFEVQLDSLNELIDARKKALQSEKNLYDYQRKVADQTKTITNIEKQMAALSGDDSEETRAKLQKLAVELDTAKQDLKDTEYDKWISDQEELLDSLSEDFEDFMENMLSDTDALIEQVIEAINQNGDIVSSTLSSLGYGNASTLSTIDNGDGTHTTTITDYNGNTTSLTFDQKGNVISSTKEVDKKSEVLDILNNYAERRGYARNPVESLFLNAGYNNYLSEEAIEKLSSISGKSWTSADDQNEANAVYDWLKEIGFANGGVVGGNSYSGDRLWARVNSGESILTRKFTDLLPETLHTMNRFINLPSCNLPSLPVTNTQPSLQMGNIDIHLDGSSVTDPKSFVDVFKNSREMQTAVQNATIGQIARSYSNSLNI